MCVCVCCPSRSICLSVQVITLYTGGLDFSGPVEEYFIGSNGKSVVDTCINLTGFALVGGPASQVGSYGDDAQK